MKITSGGIQITTAHTVLTASEVAGEGSTANKSSSGPEPITVTLRAIDDLYPGRLNSDGNYYGITFPGDYIGNRGDSKDPFWVAGARSGTGPIDYSGGINVIFNIPAGMNIGANTSGTVGSITWPYGGSQGGTKYELRENWDSSFSSASFGQWIADPSLVINLDTDEWSAAALGNLNITINNSGNTIGAGGSGGWGGRLKLGGGGGGGGQGLHPTWPGGTRWESTDAFASGDWGAGQGGGGHLVGQSGGGYDGVQGSINAGGAGGGASSFDPGTGGAAVTNGQAGGSAIYIKSNVATSVTGTTINIINQSGGRMYGGGGGGAGGKSIAGGDGGGMLTQGTFGETTNDLGNIRQGGWQGSILWVHTANLAVSNTITNENSTNPIVGWDGTWA